MFDFRSIQVGSGQDLLPPKIVLYGKGGVGKTTFGAGARKPVFLFTELGQGKLSVDRLKARDGDSLLRSYQEVYGALTYLLQCHHDFETVVLDTLDSFEPLLWEHTAFKHSKPDVESFGFGKGYTYAVDEMRPILDMLDNLRTVRGMAILILAQCDVVKFEAPDAPTYDTYQLAVQKRLCAAVTRWADCVLFARARETIIADPEHFGKERQRAVGDGQRLLYTDQRPAFYAKNRYQLPFELEFHWKAFESAIGTQVPEVEPEPTPEPEPQTQE